MEPSIVSIIIIGNWNPIIFTPVWIKKNLFGIEKDELQGLVNFEDMDFAFRHDDIIIIPKYNSMEVNIEKFDEKKGLKAGEIIIKIFELLPQTPVKAIGVNIRFELKADNNCELTKVLKGVTGGFRDFKLTQTKQSLTKDKYILNIITDYLDENFSVNFNFHYKNIITFDPQFLNEHFKETQTIFSYGA